VTALPPLPRRKPDAHKGDAGRVLVVAGSLGMTGAAFLAAKAALRTGSGIVVTACAQPCWAVLAAKHTGVMVRPFAATPEGSLAIEALEPILELSRTFDAVVIGPGLGRHPATLELARRLALRVEVPLVLDADGLNAFDGHAERLREIKVPIVLTPHPGELSGLTGKKIAEIQGAREATVRAFVKDRRHVLVLKGKGTLVGERAEPDDVRLWENKTGNPGMATAGAGDVLSGMIGALLGMGLPAWDAARLGVHLHGRAGDEAARRFPRVPVPLVATDILDRIQEVVAAQLLLDQEKKA
jgi:NAD(P)H-hydrate epimerase